MCVCASEAAVSRGASEGGLLRGSIDPGEGSLAAAVALGSPLSPCAMRARVYTFAESEIAALPTRII